MTLCDCYWTLRCVTRTSVFLLKSTATLQDMGTYLLLPKTTKVHAALSTNLMACTVIHKTYINITLNPIIIIGFAAQCVSIYSLVYKVYNCHIFQTKC